MKEKTMPKYGFLLTFALLLLLLLTACGTAVDTGGLTGRWILTGATESEINLPDGIAEEIPVRLRLDPGGGGDISDDTQSGRLQWKYEDGKITLEIGKSRLEGTVENGMLALAPEGTETILYFSPLQDEETGNDSVTAKDSELFLGDWYGWWKTEKVIGNMPVSWYDCCASFTQQTDGTVLMTLWDEECNRSEPLSEICFQYLPDDTLMSLNGYFLFQEIHKEDIILSQDSETIYLANLVHDADGESFRYSVYLRRWGERWDDSEEGQTPFYYDDWYLPLIRKKADMPDRIPWEKLEEKRMQISD